MRLPRPATSRFRLPRFSLILLVLAGALFPAQAHAQSVSWGSLTGTVVDELGDPIADVALRLLNQATGSVRPAFSSRGGTFRLDAVTPGAYELTAEAVGYRPKVVLSVPVRAGGISRVEVVLVPERPPVLGRDTVNFESPGGSWLIAGSAQSLGTAELSSLPDQTRTLDDALSFSTSLSHGMAGEGLSSRFSEIFVDGLPFRVARHPSATDDGHLFTALPRSALSLGEILTGDPEIEWARSVGPTISAFTRSSGGRRAWRVFGDWSGAGLWSSSELQGDVPSYNSVRGGFVADIPFENEGPRVALGAEAVRLQAPRSQFGIPTEQVAGLDLDPFGAAYLSETTRVSAFGRLDWRVDENSAIASRIMFGAVLEPDAPFAAAPFVPGHPMTFSGNDVSAMATYATEIENRLRVEMRMGFDRSDRSFRGPEGFGVPYPWTQFVDTGLALGTDPVFPADVTWRTFHVSPVFYLDYDEHQLKIGGYFGVPNYSYDYTFNGVAEVYTTDAVSLAGGQGVYALTNEASDPPDFSMRSLSGFAGDVWEVRPDLRLKLGARFDYDQLPGGWRRNLLWDSQSGDRRPDFPTNQSGVSGRAGLEWDAAPNTLVRASAGIHHQPTDPATIANVLYEDGDVRVRHGRNGLLVWPDMASGPIDFFGPRVTFLGEDFENPNALRVSGGLSRILGVGLTGHVWGVFRRTESMTRRVDLNRALAPTGTDQHGRAVFGDLFKRQSVVAATWPENRRLTSFEHVFALESDGWSEYAGVGAAVERRGGGPLTWFASYTFSQARDNLVGASSANPLAQLNPFEGTELATQWLEGRSDYDVPHRLAGGVEWRLPSLRGVMLGGRYSLRSGRPFTPGFRRGVDVNGDGSALNDPAFVGTGAPLGDLVSEWGCLADAVGGFAERNACRAPMVHTVDARLTVSSFEVGGQRLEIVVDALNVFDAKEGERDPAVHLIDPDVGIVQVGNLNQIPYVANESFGDLLRPMGPGRWFRIGVRLLPDA